MAGPRAPGRLHGDDLIGEVLRNMEEGLFRIRRKTLVPAIYRIYLNPDDYEPFRDVVPFIAGEIRTSLDERLAAWNGTAKQRKLASTLLRKIGAGEAPHPAEYVRVSEEWTVEIYPDLDGKLQSGEIEIHSELGAPQKAEYGAGSMTRRIVPQPAVVRVESAHVESAQVESDQAESAPATPAENTPAEETQATPLPPSASQEEDDSEQTKGRAFAYLRYADQQGPRTFEVTKNQVVIGRGGRSFWVDLKLETLPDVSREHCRIRRDRETGRFTIEDVSQFGTAVNGKPVGRNASAELPPRGTISLAGVIDLQWETV
jgi:hypothetical protein